MKRALLIVDIQQGLFADEPKPLNIDRVIDNINELARRARASGDSVYFVQHEQPDSALAFNTPQWQLDSRLIVEPIDHKVRKTSSAPFASSNLQQLMDAQGVRNVVVTGYATEFCIDSTVRWSASLGYEVTLVSDAHTTHDKPHLMAEQIIAHHNATLPSIQSLGARITAVKASDLWAQ